MEIVIKQTMTNHEVTENALQLMTAGKAFLTFQSKKSGKHFTYRIVKAEDRDGESSSLWFCSVLSGPDNESWRNYRYFGCVAADSPQPPYSGLRFFTTKKAKISRDAQSVQAFEYVFKALVNGTKPYASVFHENKCCKCGRKLTTPESIQRGIGPECAKMYGSAG